MDVRLIKKFVFFCTVGGVSATLDMTLLYCFVEYAHIPVLLSAALSIIPAIVLGFFLNKFFTFKNNSKNIVKQYIGFFLVAIVGLVLTILLLKFFITVFALHYLIAKAITIVLVTAWSFTINNLFVFKERLTN